MAMTDKTNQTLTLKDGRQLCYAEYGDPDGMPIMVVHGNPNSRLLWGVIPGSPFLPGVRLIAPDRPGFGRTEFKKGVTTLENWPNDVVELADSLGIDKFAMFGPSGGGPFALASAWKIPERLTAVGLFASVGPLLPETVVNGVPAVRLMWKYAPRLPGLYRVQMKFFAWLARNFTNLYIRMVLTEFSETDRKSYTRLKLANLLRPDRNEGYRQGGIGTWYDAMIPAGWPIPLEEIKIKVYLWQGEEDISIPLAMGQYIAEKIPDCEATFIPHVGHFWIFEHLSEMLDTLVSHSGSK